MKRLPLPLPLSTGRIRPIHHRDAHGARAGLWYDIAPVDSLIHIFTPTLLVWGRRDRMLTTGSRTLARHLVAAQVRILDDMGHDPWFEHPDLFFPLVEQFLETLPDQKP